MLNTAYRLTRRFVRANHTIKMGVTKVRQNSLHCSPYYCVCDR